ncbi:hypothetical protein GALMADRAFT_245606 [Galerina marginata CBS 339.88]|uniref:F-box domain-containing protein n=1 Tax=Galerina marginata (strain CBS 339.88) TaxID=685588 RepID=A0A067TEM8_GALM3|nr:hypothetical protein GALMADRAFT_245606 [Galerina marginata CBS 339.88]
MEDRNKRITRSSNRKAQKNSHSTSTNLTNPKAKSTRRKLETTEVIDVPVGDNTRGFPTFPDELFLEVLSYLPMPRDFVSTPATEYRAADAIEHTTRRDTLLALSQTCRSLRRFFRPYIWSRIEVCSGILAGDGGGTISSIADNRMYNEELARQLEIVTVRDPNLAEYVKMINVEVRDYSTPTVLAELARCMALFPHLHAVKLGIFPSKFERSDKLYTLARNAFSLYSYPRVEVAILSRAAYPLLRSCPSVKSVDMMKGLLYFDGDTGLSECIQGFCFEIESLTMDITAGNAQG